MSASQSPPPPQEREIPIRSTNNTGTQATGSAGYDGSAHAFSNRTSTGSPFLTARFKHVVTETVHAIATGNNSENILRCEDEPIRTPGAVQSFGALVALDCQDRLLVRIASENSRVVLGYTPDQLFALESFTNLLSQEEDDHFMDHLEFVRGDADVASSGPEVFSLSICSPTQDEVKMWCAMHVNDRHPHLVICEFELEDDQNNPLMPLGGEVITESAENTLGSEPAEEDWLASTRSSSKPLRQLRGKQPSAAMAAMGVSKILSQVQDQLGAQSTLQGLLDVLVGLVQDLTGFHRTMVYQFDQMWNGRVVAELLNPQTTRDLYKGLNFPAGDIPQQARDLYMVNKVRLLYDRDQEPARLVCRTTEDLANPLDLTHAYLRAMSPIHSQYLRNMAVRSSLSISIAVFGELWGLVTCHSYGSQGLRIPFPTRHICRIVGDITSKNIERLSYTSRLQMRTLINTVPTKQNPSGYITASSEDLLMLFQATFGFLTIRDETKMLGQIDDIETTQEALAVLNYLRKKNITRITTSTKIENDFPDLDYQPGFRVMAGILLVPLSSKGQDFIVFFRRSQKKEVRWAGNPYQKSTEGHLMPRASFKTWTQTVTGSKEWTEEELEIAAVLCLVYGKFIEVWRQKEAVLQNSQITRVLLANSAHEVRTPLNAIINYLEIALEGDLDPEIRDSLTKSFSASKSLIYVINDLLDLTATVEGGELTQNETFDLRSVLQQATEWFAKDAQRKQISYEVSIDPEKGLPTMVNGDARRLRQAISNIVANAIGNTTVGGVRVDVGSASLHTERVLVEICISDTGVGMNSGKIDELVGELAQLGSEDVGGLDDPTATARKALADSASARESRALGLGLAVVGRIVHNMCGQLRVKSEENQGSRFVLVFHFDLAEPSSIEKAAEPDSSVGVVTESDSKLSSEMPMDTATPSKIEEETILISCFGEDVFRKVKADRAEHLQLARTANDLESAPGLDSNVNRLIKAIQLPNRVEGFSKADESKSISAAKAIQDPAHAAHTAEVGDPKDALKESAQNTETADEHRLRPGSVNVPGQGQPLSASRIPDEFGSSVTDASSGALAVHEMTNNNSNVRAPSSSKMRVLVAEDDPINSKIIYKRLTKLGHDVYLTSNGEECAYTYSEEKGCFDIVLMDIQMPIMDGYTSTKNIRAFERSQSPSAVSQDGSLSLKKWVPIIAVSASLLDGEREFYKDIGFDGWILKPILFNRLQHIMLGTTDPVRRKEDLYKPGVWERGGWFEEAEMTARRHEEGETK